MANDRINRYKSFFSDQATEAVREQQKINKSSIRQLFNFGELAIAYAAAIEKDTGMVILKFPHKMAPRLNVQKGIVIISKGAYRELGSRPVEWECTWEEFVDDCTLHSAGSDMVPTRYIQCGDDGYDYVACSSISKKLYDIIEGATSEGRSLGVIVHNPFPPVEYYRNLCHYMDLYPSNEELMLEPTIEYENWHPEELAYDEKNPLVISNTILSTLNTDNVCILQGPPGTGKSYTIATVIASYLAEGKSVCATAMANKGLVELIKQQPLEEYVSHGRIYKTHLSADEEKQIKGVKDANADLMVANGELLCATNYVLSGVYSEKKGILHDRPSYDLLVIEEASQAFLTTIVAFKQLATRCLIVGDPMQLPPIVKMNNTLYSGGKVKVLVEGLKTVALGSKIKAFRIVTTFRLTERSAALTRIFYSNRFISVKKDYQDFSAAHLSLFPDEGGILYHFTNDLKNGTYSACAHRMIHKVVETMEKYFPERSLAIITPFQDTVKELQRRLPSPGITIETIDRIQGMTVDYAILYFPARNPGFAFKEKRFNVATSRSKSTTLIISDLPPEQFHSIPPKVKRFIKMCDTIDEQLNVTSHRQ